MSDDPWIGLIEPDPENCMKAGRQLVMLASQMTEEHRPLDDIQTVLSLAANMYLRADFKNIAMECLVASVSDPNAKLLSVPRGHHDYLPEE